MRCSGTLADNTMVLCILTDMNIHDIIQLGKKLERANNAAHDLWSWLPSYQRAKKLYGDYAYEKMPSMADVMAEAAIFIGNKCDPNAEECLEFAAEMFPDADADE